MKKEKYMSWDTYFMSIAFLSSFRSKDRKTQNGACIVDKDHKIIGIGYNGLPRGCDDDDPDYWRDDDDGDVMKSKHTYVVHAEKNAIYNSMAHDLRGSTMYVTQFPCNTCAQAIVQVGISRVVYKRIKEHHDDCNRAVSKMFSDSGVTAEAFDALAVEDADFLSRLEEMRNIYS